LLRLGNCSCIALPPASLQSKRKYPKKRRPGCRLFPAFLDFDEGWRKGLLPPSPTCGIPAAPLTGYSRQKLRYSARHAGLIAPTGKFSSLLRAALIVIHKYLRCAVSFQQGLPESSSVGWVERSETHHMDEIGVRWVFGYRLYPSYTTSCSSCLRGELIRINESIFDN
jgi:hypothetical protein